MYPVGIWAPVPSEYMREIEKKYEHMSLKRVHGTQPKPSQNKANAHNTRSCGEKSNIPNPLAAESMDESQADGMSDGGGSDGSDEGEWDDVGGPEAGDEDGVGGDESEDEDNVPPEKGDSDDDRSSAGSAEDSDEIGSDSGYESYGLADL